MKKLLILTLAALALFIGTVVTHGQDTESAPVESEVVTLDSTDGTATLTLKQQLPLFATVELNINGQIYQLKVPVTLDIDASSILDNVSLKASEASRVGNLDWQITEIREYTDEYSHGFRTFEPSSPARKLIVVESNVTNLSDAPFEIYTMDEMLGIDEAGNRYEYEDRVCDTINPGATNSCILIFDVPHSVTLTGLDLTAPHSKTIQFQPSANGEAAGEGQ